MRLVLVNRVNRRGLRLELLACNFATLECLDPNRGLLELLVDRLRILAR